jgi:hypothetical protein
MCSIWSSCKISEQTQVGIPEPPGQLSSGPGGADYNHTSARATSYGKGEDQYWIFEPMSPTPTSAPLIIFNHGWGAKSPKSYTGWIDHIVRKGNIVVYPRYQSLMTPSNKTTDTALRAVKNAIQTLESGEHVRPQLDKIAIVGHSHGSGISVNMAALGDSADFPVPKAVMVVEPGSMSGENLLSDLSGIPSETLMLVLVGEDDDLAKYDIAKEIYNSVTTIPTENKDFITMISDNHGEPSLVADHFAPLSIQTRYNFSESIFQSAIGTEIVEGIAETDAMDYYGLWKLFDGLIDAAFYGKNREYALGNTPEQRFMGIWSDGKAVKELIVTKNP